MKKVMMVGNVLYPQYDRTNFAGATFLPSGLSPALLTDGGATVNHMF